MGIFKCCCSECDLVIGDLPDITITGMTGAGWEEIGQCCFKQEFTYNDEQDWQDETTLDYFDCVEEQEDQYKVIGMSFEPRPFYTDSTPPPDPITDESFCCYVFEQMGTMASSIRTRTRRRMFIEWLNGSVTVFISKETLDCLSDPAVEKWVVSLKHNFTYRGRLEQLYYCYGEVTWVPISACFELIAPTTTTTVTCNEGSEDWADFVLGTPVGNSQSIAESTTYTLRHKWYDTLPSTIEFGDSDVALEACPITCHDLNDVVDEICVEKLQTITTVDSWGPDVCDTYSNSTMADSINMQRPSCPTSVSVSIYPDVPADPCDIGLALVSLAVTCPDAFYRAIIGTDIRLQQLTSCCAEATDPCGNLETYCMFADFLEHTYKNHFATGGYTSRSVCFSSTVTLDVTP
jgi:hypothetical protein